MGDPHRYPTMIDDMGGLYSHASEVFAAGQRRGRDDYYRALQPALSAISVEQESGPVNGPEEKVATRGFHVAEACCKAARELKERMDDKKKTV
jgi:hypothetical protein